MESPEPITHVQLVWVYLEGNTIVRTREQKYPLLMSGRLTQAELDTLCGDNDVHPKEVVYSHMTNHNQPASFVRVPSMSSTANTDNANPIKGITFAPSLPIYHEFTTVVFFEWLRVSNAKPSTRKTRKKQTAHGQQKHTKHTRKRLRFL